MKKIKFNYTFDNKLYKFWLSLFDNWYIYYIFDLKNEKIKKIFSKNDKNFIENLNKYLKQYKIKAIENKDFYIMDNVF